MVISLLILGYFGYVVVKEQKLADQTANKYMSSHQCLSFWKNLVDRQNWPCSFIQFWRVSPHFCLSKNVVEARGIEPLTS